MKLRILREMRCEDRHACPCIGGGSTGNLDTAARAVRPPNNTRNSRHRGTARANHGSTPTQTHKRSGELYIRRASAPEQGNKQFRWVWIGVAIVLLGAGGIFAYPWLHVPPLPPAVTCGVKPHHQFSFPPPTLPPPPQPGMTRVPAGTNVTVQIIDPIDTGVNHMGDILHASLGSPIIVGNRVVVPQGTDAYLRVFAVHAGEHKGRPAELRLVLDHLVYRGQYYALASSSFDMFGSSRGKRNAEVTGGISRGEQVHVAPGAEISFQLIQPANLALSNSAQ